MKFFAKAALPLFIVLGALSSQARADITLNITQNATSGTNWAFSGGTGTIGGSANPYMLVGSTTASPLNFLSSNSFNYDGSLTVLSGVNTFNLQNIFVLNYGGLPGTAGSIGEGIDFQGGGVWANAAISGFNGLVLHANSIAYSAFNPGSYVLPSYYSGYNTDLGKFTLNIGAVAPVSDVPEPGSLAILGLGLVGAALVRRRKVKAA